ncbi:MAG: GlsB/YeaQ/YmgE family stress response membrane protein [Chloroflexaceae bacterium]|nr:GlsB/YeaQ/YmgE family stress response membrane protein [Chloroflexaceae bacterium]
MGIISWIIFGAIAGWLASIVAGTNERQGCFMNIIVGIVGAFLGGFAMELLFNRTVDWGFNPTSFIVAVIGAVALLFITGAARRSRR